jgi:hypothetical protein
MKPIAKYILSIAALAVFGVPLRVTAQSCGPYLKNINNWFVTQPQGPGR